MSGRKLNGGKAESLKQILSDHSRLAACCAMKEEMSELFVPDDPDIAEERWIAWFNAAKASHVPQLVKLAELKEKRLEGLISQPSVRRQFHIFC